MKTKKRPSSPSQTSVEKNLISCLEKLIPQLSNDSLLIVLKKAHIELNK
jgi:hypothetical protein